MNYQVQESDIALLRKAGVPEDDTIREHDIRGRTIFDLPEGPLLGAGRNCLRGLSVP